MYYATCLHLVNMYLKSTASPHLFQYDNKINKENIKKRNHKSRLVMSFLQKTGTSTKRAENIIHTMNKLTMNCKVK